MEAIRSSEKLVLTRVTRRHIPEDCILHSHRRENLKSVQGLLTTSSLSVRIFLQIQALNGRHKFFQNFLRKMARSFSLHSDGLRAGRSEFDFQ
jgi:hypothetical protein